MAASADNVNNGAEISNDNTKNSKDHEFGQWQTYISDFVPLSQKIKWKKRDPVSIERSNLVNICKLVVKELIESSLKYGRMLDSDSIPLQHFFIVLEHVMRHGLKPKRGLLGPKKELWDLFQMVEKLTTEAQDITSSVRDLPTVNSHTGRARAWLRLALMQKKLPDYFRLLIERRDDFLRDFYEPGSLMLADEAVVIMGLLVGLNVIDCNLCVKEEDLDSQMGVIDFSLYLRNSVTDLSSPDNLQAPLENKSDMTTVLDQKNYIEELNRHLNATVTDLQSRVENLVTTNALMKEDLSIAKKTIIQLQEENDNLRKQMGAPTQQQQEQLDREAKKASRISVIGCEEEMQDLKRNLEEESAHRKQVEMELELQIQMKAEREMAAKLLEKDLQEKQETIESLRTQLDEIKDINLEMYNKLMECEQEIGEKGLIVARLQEKSLNISQMLTNLQLQPENCKGYQFGGLARSVDMGSSRGNGRRDPDRRYSYREFDENVSHKSSGIKKSKSMFVTADADLNLGDSPSDQEKECEASLKSKTEQIVQLEESSIRMNENVHELRSNLELVEQSKEAAKSTARKLTQMVSDEEHKRAMLEADLHLETETRRFLEGATEREAETAITLEKKTEELDKISKEYETLKSAHIQLIGTVEDQERTLEELGVHLSESKLKVSEYSEVSKSLRDAQWAPDKEAVKCNLCTKEFNITRRRHHCRNCGNIYCHSCSENTMPLPSSARPVRVCDTCYTELLSRYSTNL